MLCRSDRYPAQFAQDIFAITTGKASDKNTAIALTDREAWCAISMRRAQAHGGAAMPGATESTYEIDEFLGWSSGCKRHGIPPACRSEEHTYEFQSLMRNSYAVFCLKKNTSIIIHTQCEYNNHRTH